MTWNLGKTRVTSPAVLWISNFSNLIVTQIQMLCQGQLEALTVENWWDVPWKDYII